MRYLLLIPLAFFLFGSGIALAQEEFLENLEPVKVHKFLHIKQRIVVSQHNPIFDATSVNSLSDGVYVAVMENEFGTFYRGVGFPVLFGNESMSFIQAGGVWVSKKDPVKKMRFFLVMGPENQQRHSSLEAAYIAQRRAIEELNNLENKKTAAIVNSKEKSGDDQNGFKTNPSSDLTATDNEKNRSNEEVMNQMLTDKILNDPVGRGMSPAQAGLAGGIVYLLISYIEKDAIERNRGKFTFLAQIPMLTLDSYSSAIEFNEAR